MKQVVLTTVLGLPGSGKSTLCERLHQLETNDCSVMWLEYDQLVPVQILSLKANNSDWKDWRQAVVGCLEKLLALWKGFDIIHDLNEKEKVIWLRINIYSTLDAKDIIVLLDDNFYYFSMRRSFYNLAKKYSCSYASIVCKCAIDTCILRNRARPSPVPDDTIHKMERKFEWPDPVNNLWEKHTITISSLQENVHNPVSLLRFLKLLLNQPIISEDSVKDEEKNRSKRINLDSLLHNVDIHLRKVTNHTIKSKDCLWRTQYAKMASDIKAQCLQELHKTIFGGNSIWTVENCQKFAEELFYEKLDEVLNKKVTTG
ncbi:hypothetical protein MS3_00005148 [Schistosoma haematobium]|nr:hypothetical protein MS3_00005148 [Schistosoma haematobium]KAH9587393.1 hypothetical protein MS3_00005148 [Schistosoma haematobium]CAH8545853.1 unnamed protein product [Schistosoma haematobium]CAH8549857.1 unnamed protein product [Schistosoma haematobium]